jgi:beta-glucosidase
MTGTGEQALQARVDELIAGMTPAEKAGQLTQYFYFGFQRDVSTDLDPGTGAHSQPGRVEAALGRGEVGSLLFATDPSEINRLQRLTVEGHRLGVPALFGFDVIHGLRTDPPRADRPGRVVGPRDHRARSGRRRP